MPKRTGEDGDLQDLAFGDRLGDVLRKDVQQEVVPVRAAATAVRVCAGSGRCGNDEPDSGLRQVDGDEADDQREGGERLRSRRGDLMPMRPTDFRSPWPAMPVTSVAKMSGATMVLMRRRKMSEKTRR